MRLCEFDLFSIFFWWVLGEVVRGLRMGMRMRLICGDDL